MSRPRFTDWRSDGAALPGEWLRQALPQRPAELVEGAVPLPHGDRQPPRAAPERPGQSEYRVEPVVALQHDSRMMLLAPTNPLWPRLPDDHFAAEAHAASGAGINVAVVDHDELTRDDPYRAVAAVPEASRSTADGCSAATGPPPSPKPSPSAACHSAPFPGCSMPLATGRRSTPRPVASDGSPGPPCRSTGRD